uniref:Protein kinase domain-containing protein n=1 Tax=Kalanchoe fedtschenkoi TaxID=63787 RepID=A0A7N0RJW2_KALFE
MAWTRGRQIGKGSTAAVSVATSGDFPGEILAVKSAEFSKSQFLQREKEILSALSSPHIVGYKGFDISKGESNELYYNLFMEYVPGGTLADEIRRRGGRMDEQTIRAFTCQILKAAEYLHSNGVSHCDIKGSNILISEEHGAKLADFGCSKRAGGRESNGAVSVSGTPVYMAPEAARGEEQGPEADIWAVGCTVIEMATGGPAWPVSDPARILYRIAFSDQIPAFPSSLSEQGKDFLSKCLVRDRSQRWTATELLSHPFVTKLEFFHQPKSISPTSILDHQIWNASDDESASQTGMEMEVGTSGELRDEDRIEQLAGVSGRPDWDWGSDEDWIPVRSESGSTSQIRDECWSSKLEDAGWCVEEEFDDCGFAVGDFSIDFGSCCRYVADPSVSSLIISP